MQRRDFLALGGMGAAGLLLSPMGRAIAAEELLERIQAEVVPRVVRAVAARAIGDQDGGDVLGKANRLFASCLLYRHHRLAGCLAAGNERDQLHGRIGAVELGPFLDPLL